MLSIESVKKQANLLKIFLNEKHSNISHSSCLQAIAKINGYKDWNTMQSVLENHEEINDMSCDSNSKSYVDDVAARLHELESYVYELANQVDKIQSQVDEHEPYILMQQGIDPWNPPDQLMQPSHGSTKNQ